MSNPILPTSSSPLRSETDSDYEEIKVLIHSEDRAVVVVRDKKTADEYVAKVWIRNTVRLPMFLSTLRHPILANGMLESPPKCVSFGQSVLLTPRAPLGALGDYERGGYEQLSDANKVQIVADVLRGLIYIHSHRVYHGNLKPSNILLFDGCRARLTGMVERAALGKRAALTDDMVAWASLVQAFYKGQALHPALNRVLADCQNVKSPPSAILVYATLHTVGWAQCFPGDGLGIVDVRERGAALAIADEFDLEWRQALASWIHMAMCPPPTSGPVSPTMDEPRTPKRSSPESPPEVMVPTAATESFASIHSRRSQGSSSGPVRTSLTVGRQNARPVTPKASASVPPRRLDSEAIADMVRRGAINESKFNRTPLSKAIEADDFELVRDLLEAGADPCLMPDPRRSQRTPLHIAARGGNVQIVKELLARGAVKQLDTLDAQSETPLVAAITGRHELVAITLLREGAVAGNSKFVAPLMLACKLGQEAVVDAMLESGADVAWVDEENSWTPLHWAAWFGSKAIVDRLLSLGANADARDRLNRTPAAIANIRHHLDLRDYLLTVIQPE